MKCTYLGADLIESAETVCLPSMVYEGVKVAKQFGMKQISIIVNQMLHASSSRVRSTFI